MLPDPKAIRRSIIEMLYRGGAAHLGPSLSAVECLIAMYSSSDLNKIIAGDAQRDRVIISKGHAAAATYATMYHFGLLSKKQIDTYHTDGTYLGGHTNHRVPFVEASTGAALGHGLPIAVGIAFGLKAQKAAYKLFDPYERDPLVMVLCGDGEMQEGVSYEALTLARHHNLGNLVVIIDSNKISSIGPVNDVITDNWINMVRGMDCILSSVDGHNVEELMSAIASAQGQTKPSVIVAHTVKGKGYSAAEGSAAYHYRPLSKETYEQAMGELK